MTIIKLPTNETWTSQDHYDPANVWRKRIMSLANLATLEPDWDGEDAIPPEAAAIKNAVRLMYHFRSVGTPPPSRIAATLDGGVLIEWQEQNRYIEFEVTDSNSVEWVIIEDNGQPVHGEIDVPVMGEAHMGVPDSTISCEEQYLQYG